MIDFSPLQENVSAILEFSTQFRVDDLREEAKKNGGKNGRFILMKQPLLLLQI